MNKTYFKIENKRSLVENIMAALRVANDLGLRGIKIEQIDAFEREDKTAFAIDLSVKEKPDEY